MPPTSEVDDDHNVPAVAPVSGNEQIGIDDSGRRGNVDPDHSRTHEPAEIAQHPHQFGIPGYAILLERSVERRILTAKAAARTVVEKNQAVFVVVRGHSRPPLPRRCLRHGNIVVDDPCDVKGDIHAEVTSPSAAFRFGIVLHYAIFGLPVSQSGTQPADAVPKLFALGDHVVHGPGAPIGMPRNTRQHVVHPEDGICTLAGEKFVNLVVGDRSVRP